MPVGRALLFPGWASSWPPHSSKVLVRSLWLYLHWEHYLCSKFSEKRLFKPLLYDRYKGWPNPAAASQKLLVVKTSQEQVHRSFRDTKR